MELQTNQNTEGNARRSTAGSAKAEAEGPTFTITQLAEEFSVTTRAIRFYEDKGLLHPGRQGQTRIYRPRDRARLALIVRGKRVGLPLVEIREILDSYDLGDGGATHYKIGLKKLRNQIETLRQRKAEIDDQIDQLQEGCDRIAGILTKQFGVTNP